MSVSSDSLTPLHCFIFPSLLALLQDKIDSVNVEVAVIGAADAKFRLLSKQELQALIDQLKETGHEAK